GIEQQISQYHIASYLGIKPESLSRIKLLTYINK
ncbi:helix-turn-helix domain-containing protein, partial [Flavobacterium circumlabens]